MKPLHLCLAVAVMLVWGCSFVVAKLAITEMPPMLFMGIRYVMTGVLLLPFMLRERSRLWQVFGISVTLGFLHFACGFTGLLGVDAAISVMLMQAQVPFAALLAVLFFGEKIGWQGGFGMLVAFVGVFLLAGEPQTASAPISAGLIVVAAFLWAFSAIQVKRLGVMDPLALNGWVAVFAAPQMLIASFLLESGHGAALERIGPAIWFGFAYLILAVTVFGYGVWYWLLQRYEVNRVLPLTLLTPVFGFLAGIWFLNESAEFTRLFGAIIVLLGVSAIVLQPGRRAAAKS